MCVCVLFVGIIVGVCVYACVYGYMPVSVHVGVQLAAESPVNLLLNTTAVQTDIRSVYPSQDCVMALTIASIVGTGNEMRTRSSAYGVRAIVVALVVEWVNLR